MDDKEVKEIICEVCSKEQIALVINNKTIKHCGCFPDYEFREEEYD